MITYPIFLIFYFFFFISINQGAWDTGDGTDSWAKYCGNLLWLEFGCFLGTSLLQLRNMGKLLPGEWYDAEVEDDGIARYSTFQ